MNGINGVESLIANARENLTITLQAYASGQNGDYSEDNEKVNWGIVPLAKMFVCSSTEEERQEILDILRKQTKSEEEFRRLIRQLEFFALIETLQQAKEQKDRNTLIKEKNYLRQLKQILEDARENEELLNRFFDVVALIIGGVPIEYVCLNLKAEIRRIDVILSSTKEGNRE